MRVLCWFALAAVALPVSAQVSAEFPEMPQSLVRYFGFTPAQAADIRALNVSLSDFFDRQLEKLDELEELVSDELEKPSPDSALVGSKIVEMVMIEREVEREMETTVTKVQAILTEEQKKRLQVLEDAMGLRGTISQAMQWSILAPSDDFGFGLFLSGPAETDRKKKHRDRLSRWLSPNKKAGPR